MRERFIGPIRNMSVKSCRLSLWGMYGEKILLEKPNLKKPNPKKLKPSAWSLRLTQILALGFCAFVFLTLSSCGIIFPNAANLTVNFEFSDITLDNGNVVSYQSLITVVQDKEKTLGAGDTHVWDLRWFGKSSESFNISYDLKYTVTDAGGISSIMIMSGVYTVRGVVFDDFISVNFYEADAASNDPEAIRIEESKEIPLW